MNIWRIGSNWDNKDISPIFRELSAVFAGAEVEHLVAKVDAGDLVAVTHGQKIIAVGKVIELADLKDVSQKYFGYYGDIYAIKVNPLYFESDFKKIDFGSYDGTGKQFHQAHGGYITHIINIFNTINYMAKNKAIEDIIKYKKQIILQGPPGTGKTHMAKEIARKMVEPKNITGSLITINNFFKNFDSTDESVQSKRKELNDLMVKFQSKFSVAKLKSISLDSYCIGTGTNNSFCWWIEKGLQRLGSYSPGNSKSYQIYWDKTIQDYSLHGKLLNGVKDAEEAIKLVSDVLCNVVKSKDIYQGTRYFGDSFLLKILNSYYPNEFFPINSRKCLSNALKLIGEDPTDKEKLEMNQRLVQLLNSKNKEFSRDVTPFEFMGFLFANFDLKGEIAFEADKIYSKGEYKLIQFHPAYTYEDFVRGIVAKTNNDDKVYYEVQNKILANFAKKALENPSADFVLIIDEINRANLPAVLGELIYAMEYRYDCDNSDETTVESMYSLKSSDANITDEDDESTENVETKENKELKLPPNLYIIGTMNTADRSVGHIDYAIRRRFAFVDVLPSDSVIDEVVKDANLNKKAKDLYSAVAILFTTEYLAPDFKGKHVQLGHSYFLAESEDQLKLKLEYEIKPLLNEYLKDGIFKDEKIIDKINSLNV